MMRWWWFGPAVTNAEISKELEQMHSAGIGGVELASVYPMSVDDESKGIQNFRYTSPEHISALRFAVDRARALHMRADVTLGTGWPFGGPHIPISLAAGKLKIIALPLPAKASSLPALAEGDTLIASFEAQGTPSHYNAATARQRTDWSLKQELTATSSGDHVALIFISSHTRQMVKRASVGGEGFVLDHMSRAAIDTHLHTVGDKLLKGFSTPPTAIFSDSLEVYGSDWTKDLPAEFKRRRGYDIIPHLPELAAGGTPQAEAVRHDWGVTLSDLVRENYLQPVTDYAHAHGTLFRSQTYGEPAATLSDVHIPDLPEGEGPQWDAFSFTRWTTSANHIFGRNITSAETWTWLHSPAFRATPLDMKAEADRMFLEGVNQIIGHGWPYSAPSAQEPGWSLYAAAVFDAHNPWWPVMPDVMRYLHRVSWLLRQGAPANDIALLLPEDDAQASFIPGHVSVTEEMKSRITPALMRSILAAGYNVDYIDNAAIAARGVGHPVLVIPPTRRMSLSAAQRIADFARSGGKVIFIGETPSLAAGMQDSLDANAVRAAVQSAIQSSQHVNTEADLPSALHTALAPDWKLEATSNGVGFIHRHASSFDIYFIANTSNSPQQFTTAPRTQRKRAEWWDPETGKATTARIGEDLTLAPYESRVLVLSNNSAPAPHSAPHRASTATSLPLEHWSATFPGSALSSEMPTRDVASTAWTDASDTRNYSGEVRYTSHINVQSLTKDQRSILRFAPPAPIANTQPANKPGTRAWIEAPIRDAAIVLVNGKRAGVLWHPPYQLDITSFTHTGSNTIELRVFNTAINAMAAQPPRDFSALTAKYGERFQMQDMDHLEPAPSGIVGPVTLEIIKEQK